MQTIRTKGIGWFIFIAMSTFWFCCPTLLWTYHDFTFCLERAESERGNGIMSACLPYYHNNWSYRMLLSCHGQISILIRCLSFWLIFHDLVCVQKEKNTKKKRKTFHHQNSEIKTCGRTCPPRAHEGVSRSASSHFRPRGINYEFIWFFCH
jgi:hypothetical protein